MILGNVIVYKVHKENEISRFVLFSTNNLYHQSLKKLVAQRTKCLINYNKLMLNFMINHRLIINGFEIRLKKSSNIYNTMKLPFNDVSSLHLNTT